MNYWHMQIKYYDIVKNEKTFLKIRDDGDNKEIIEIFNNEVKINDIILIKNRQRPIYLVKIIGVMKNNQIEIEIFNRNTKILNDYPLGTVDTEIKKVSNKSLPAYQYIDKLYKGDEKSLITDVKIKELFINNYKMFENFKINFTDEKDKVLPLIVIAGINGSGKTSLLELISDFKPYYQYFLNNESYIKIQYKDKEISIDKNFIQEYEYIEKQNKYSAEIQLKQGNQIAITTIPDKFSSFLYLEKHITYIKAQNDNIIDLKKSIVSYYKKESRRLDSYNKALEQIKKFIAKIFIDLDILFILSDIDDIETDNEKVTFKNKNGKEFDINQLSTGEKTLLSKVLYLYFKDVKNQIILIDEPELSLHPAWQNRVLKLYENFAKENNCQIIITTHSPHILANTPHKYLRFLVEEDNKIVAKKLNNSPLDRDINTIIKTIMGADYIPKELQELHETYRKLFDEGKIETEEAEKIKKEILKYESINSSFFQGIAFDMELMKCDI